jgi:tetraacyldisaccharide 4'-kinase
MRHWRSLNPLSILLLPLAGLFRMAMTLRRWMYEHGWLATFQLGVPVVVVGNITAGGTGKTPLVIALVKSLQRQGYRPGVVSRGHGGTGDQPTLVTPDSDPRCVGDEPVLIAWRTQAPIAVGRDRVAAARLLLARSPGIDLILSDDGLQHYRLGRSLELAVVDGAAGLGNGLPLPSGPLREPASRLKTVDAVIVTCRLGQARSVLPLAERS